MRKIRNVILVFVIALSSMASLGQSHAFREIYVETIKTINPFWNDTLYMDGRVKALEFCGPLNYSWLYNLPPHINDSSYFQYIAGELLTKAAITSAQITPFVTIDNQETAVFSNWLTVWNSMSVEDHAYFDQADFTDSVRIKNYYLPRNDGTEGQAIIKNDDMSSAWQDVVREETDPLYSADLTNIVHFDDIQVVKSASINKLSGYDTVYFNSPFVDENYVVQADAYVDAMTNVEMYIISQNPGYFIVYSPVECTMSYTATGVSEKDMTEWYGVEWDVTSSNPDVTRIASNMDYHASLPVQSSIRACLLSNDGSVNYYLDPDDWTKREDGTASNLDGSDGMVMVEIPAHYYRFEKEGDTRRIMITPYYVRGFEYQRKIYVSAYEAAINRDNNTLASVKNTTTTYRGGNNDATRDGQDNTLLGRPVTYPYGRDDFRIAAHNRGAGWEMYTYEVHNVIWRLFLIEYATRNSQKAYDATLTAQGYKKGGLGPGVTTASSGEWSAFSSYYPFIPCGASNSIGTHTGEYSYTVDNFGGAGVNRTFKVNRYRGIEMPFGHIWKNCDGILTVMESDAEGGRTRVYITNENYSDSDTTGMSYLGDLPRANGYVTDVQDNSFLPFVVTGGNSSTYYCDYSYQSNHPSSGISYRTLLVGGNAYAGSRAGFGYSTSYFSPSLAYANFGVRLCFFGE